jgi:hypothetical protein
MVSNALSETFGLRAVSNAASKTYDMIRQRRDSPAHSAMTSAERERKRLSAGVEKFNRGSQS